jgi:hypothetical protein
LTPQWIEPFVVHAGNYIRPASRGGAFGT